MEGCFPMAKQQKPEPQMKAAPAGAAASSTSTSLGEPSSPARTARRGKGLPVPRHFTPAGQTAAQALDAVVGTRRPAKSSGADGEVVF